LEDSSAASPPEDLPVRAPLAKHTRGRDWGHVMSAMYQRTPEYSPPTLPAQRGETVRERINCWHQGAVATDAGVDRPLSDSVRPVVTALERGGYEDLAAILREL
jgi:hypothetical protein